jgi:uncharacterized protein YjbI with pentapeptide repeats
VAGDATPSKLDVLEPRLAEPLNDARHAELQSHDEWRGERVDGADLIGRDAERVEITGSELRGVRFTGSRLDHLRLVDVLAVDCELSGAIITVASLQRVAFVNCRMAGLVISDSKLRHVRFESCKLDGANFRFVNANHVVADDCSLVEADFTNAVFTKSAFSRCDLRAGVFTKASVAGTRFAGSNVEALQGASSLRGAIVGTDQVLPVALGVFGDLGIVISDEDPVTGSSATPRTTGRDTP